MCGIVGIYAYHRSAGPVDRDELLRIRDAMYARGPDDEGAWVSTDGRIGLGSRRLAIIDLTAAGAQPMVSADGRYRIVFNGEIYNHRALRKELEASGYRFTSDSDTEVVLNLYAARGARATEALRGMYAFAIVDGRDGSMFLARDAFGIKPLYYCDDGKTFRFASQVKALLKGGAIRTTPSAAGHVGFFLWGHVPDPFTLHAEIRALPAGSSMMVDGNGHHAIQPFFDINAEFIAAQDREVQLDRAERSRRLHVALRDSVEHHLIADVPVGVFLSSGLDSSTITALASEFVPGNLHTLTLGFDEYRGTKDDETPLAEQMAREYGTIHRTMWVSKSDFESEIERMLEAMDQPSIDGVNTYFVSRAAAAAGMKVALSGVGGDELFGGYPSFREVPLIAKVTGAGKPFRAMGKAARYVLAPLLRNLTSPKFAGLFEYGGALPGAYLLRRGLYMPWELDDVMDEAFVREGLDDLRTIERLTDTVRGVDSPFRSVSALEMGWYMRNQLLRDSDWAGMAHSVEIRVPFVDVPLLRSVAPLMNRHGMTKTEMVGALKRPLPQAITQRRKTGFSIPVREWFVQIDPKAATHRGLRSWARKVNPPLPRRKRFLALVTDAYGGYGGIALYNRDLLKALCSSPLCREVVALPRLMPNVPEPYPKRLRYVTSGLKGKRNYFAALTRLLWENRKFDMIICGHINLVPLAYLAHLFTRAPIILMIYGIDAWLPTDRPISNYLISRILAYVSISRVTQERFLGWATTGKARGAILPNAIDLSAYAPGPKNPELERRYGVAGKKVIMTVGRLVSAERYKGFDEVLESLPELMRDTPNLVYVIVGEGSDRQRLSDKASALGIEEHVVFTGHVPESEKAEIYRLADAFIMASRGEGFGFVILEALATGIPTVASNIDGGREAIREGMLGILVDPDKPEDVVRAARQALRSEKKVPEGLEFFSYPNFESRLHELLEGWLSRDSLPEAPNQAATSAPRPAQRSA